MNVYASWAIFLAILGALSWHYAGRPNLLSRINFQNASQELAQQTSGSATRKQRVKAKRGGGPDIPQDEPRPADQPASTAGNVSKKRKIAAPQPSRTPKAYSSGSVEDSKQNIAVATSTEDVISNTNFAREMAIARAGTQFAGSIKPGNSKEHRVQKQENLRPSNGTNSPSMSTGASSTTGADADDDLSPVTSPRVAAASKAETSKSLDVSDMLEPAAAGPSVLRLTEPANPPSQAKSKKVVKAFEPAETKKQRQNRMKREAKRAIMEEAERERRKLLEKQIRGARMAEGTSTQLKTSSFKPPAENPWFSDAHKGGSENTNAPPLGSQPLLDTFDPKLDNVSSTTPEARTAPVAFLTNQNLPATRQTSRGAEIESVAEGPANASALSKNHDKDWVKDLPLEEEQMRLIQDAEESWTTVSKRDKKKAPKMHSNKDPDTSDASVVESRHANGFAPKTATSSAPAVSNSSNSYHSLGESGLQDSDWAA